jgi:hypothetical protein
MSKLMTALFIAAGLSFAGGATAQMASSTNAPATKDTYDAAVKNADARYKTDKDACSSLSGNAKDICVEEAKAKLKSAKADAEASYKNTPKARADARVAHAEGEYNVAKEKCDDLSGNPKDVCVKEAKAALVKAKANAKVDRVAADTSNDSAMKQADARKEASDDKRDADYKVAIEKCDALAGAAKDTCVRNAKTRFGKS